jgi:hypothetical protein
VADETLALAGWQVVRIWEHESLEQALAAVIAAVGARMPPAPAASVVDPAASVVDPAAGSVNPVAPAGNPVAPAVDQVAPDDDPVAADGLRASRSADKI